MSDDKLARRVLYSRIRRSMVALALGHAEARDDVGKTTTLTSGLLRIVGSGFFTAYDGAPLVVSAGHVLGGMVDLRKSRIERGENPPDLLWRPNREGFIDADADFAYRFELVLSE